MYARDVADWKNSNLLHAQRAFNPLMELYNCARVYTYIRLQLISDRFLGDIALPNIKYDTEWREQKLNKSYLEELSKYREEIFNEGLQVEEEGLTGEYIYIFCIVI